MKVDWCDQHDQERMKCRRAGLAGCFGSIVEANEYLDARGLEVPGSKSVPGRMTFTVLERGRE